MPGRYLGFLVVQGRPACCRTLFLQSQSIEYSFVSCAADYSEGGVPAQSAPCTSQIAALGLAGAIGHWFVRGRPAAGRRVLSQSVPAVDLCTNSSMASGRMPVDNGLGRGTAPVVARGRAD